MPKQEQRLSHDEAEEEAFEIQKNLEKNRKPSGEGDFSKEQYQEEAEKIWAGKKIGQIDIIKDKEEQKEKIIDFLLSRDSRKLLKFCSENQVTSEVIEDPKVEKYFRNFLIQHWGSSSTLLGKLFDIIDKLPISKRLRNDPEIKPLLIRQITSNMVEHYPDKDISKKMLKNIEQFNSLRDKLQLDEDETRDLLKGTFNELLDINQVDNFALVAEKFNYPIEDVKGRLSDLISRSISNKKIDILLDAIKRYGLNKDDFKAEVKRSLSNYFYFKYLDYAKEKFQLDDADLVEVVTEHGISGIIGHLDEMPDYLLTLLEGPHLLASYKKDLANPLINIYDPAVYTRYIKIKKGGDSKTLDKFIKELTEPTGANKEVLRLTTVIKNKMIEHGNPNPFKYKEQLVSENYNTTDDRDLSMANSFASRDLARFFSEEKPVGIKEAVEKVSKGKKVKVLELGAGLGIILTELKVELEEDGYKAEMTALEVDDYRVSRLQRGKVVDKVEGVPAELYMPRESYDCVMDIYGAISYTEPYLRQDLILKYSYALKKGGVMIVAFDFYKYEDEEILKDYPHVIQKTLVSSDEKKGNVDFEAQADAIVKSLEKRGFKASLNFNESNKGAYHCTLIVQRAN